MFVWSLPPVVCRKAHVLFTLFVFLYILVSNTYCVVLLYILVSNTYCVVFLYILVSNTYCVVFLYILVSNTYCVVLLLCLSSSYVPFLWIVHFSLPLRYSLTFSVKQETLIWFQRLPLSYPLLNLAISFWPKRWTGNKHSFALYFSLFATPSYAHEI
jgi:hypothetical protein